MPDDLHDIPVLLLSAARALVDGIDSRVREAGFTDIRPAHGFAFARISGAGATVTELAEHLEITKQAASQMAEELIRKGYLKRGPHPADARARLLTLTERGNACTEAATAAANATLRPLATALTPGQIAALRTALLHLAEPGRIRPVW
ncbi:MarR family winged helix-turn-helix transcriptional regulator [Actinoplanes derwentensis]|uniref:DNA-binding transcriptional regulator, MarR family n=1 Tax=Actinoplanes derwentensis TaxID=113562 RepID=A0A1H2D964_9ACTN|nr:MarR family transcriptional regulator [Actinoplanes derwentensis]GID86410.1 MarR family transcriptional regulator [Actinoplanes derwentensis]SDT79134.1 DNA-binding transcriptional regulator, MarR family [Actinoplanes derwentensis]